MKRRSTAILFGFMLVLGVTTAGSEDELTLERARALLRSNRWRPVVCEGIPASIPKAGISRHRNGTRTDIKTESNVYVIYEEFVPTPEGRQFHPERLYDQLNGVETCVFRYSPYAKLARHNYIDILGFSGGRLFTIHAWQPKDATENESMVAQRIAGIAAGTLRTRGKQKTSNKPAH